MSKFNENLKDLFTNWNTIPNWLCFFRIACIPVFTTLFIKGMYIPAFIIMIVAALSDVFDGKIARKYNMVSNLGKILDPIADKLTQAIITDGNCNYSYRQVLGRLSQIYSVPVYCQGAADDLRRSFAYVQGPASCCRRGMGQGGYSSILHIYDYYYCNWRRGMRIGEYCVLPTVYSE